MNLITKKLFQNLKKPLTKILFFISLFAFSFLSETKECQQLVINHNDYCFEVAETTREKRKGLMYRKYLEANSGMIFVWRNPKERCMWMKNTSIPLDIGFFDENGILLQTEQLVPFSTKSVCSNFGAKYALEVNRGWFLRENIAISSKITFKTLN